MFGSFPINNIKPEDMFDASGSYRIYFKSTILDTITNVILGLTTTLSLKTVIVENCNSTAEPVIVLQKSDLEVIIKQEKELVEEEMKLEIEEEDIKFENQSETLKSPENENNKNEAPKQ